jgi:ribosomal protein S18 acetylase RimI-like enzyme
MNSARRRSRGNSELRGMVAIREANLADIPAIFAVRTAVKENAATIERLAELGITPALVGDALKSHCKAWVTNLDGHVVGFVIADMSTKSIWALFVLPEFESRGIGKALMLYAVRWLKETGADRCWLTTGSDTRAAGFYRRLGWTAQGLTAGGEMKFELDLTLASS